jgi:hypothetical protein
MASTAEEDSFTFFCSGSARYCMLRSSSSNSSISIGSLAFDGAARADGAGECFRFGLGDAGLAKYVDIDCL